MSKTKAEIEMGGARQDGLLLVGDARDAGPLSFVDPKKAYRLTIQLGQNNQWRSFRGGEWVRDVSQDKKGQQHWKHIAAVYRGIGPFAGETVNGLIAQHNQFLLENEQRTKSGDIARQILVSNVEETSEPPITDGPVSVQTMIASVAKEVAKELVMALIAAGALVTPQAKPENKPPKP